MKKISALLFGLMLVFLMEGCAVYTPYPAGVAVAPAYGYQPHYYGGHGWHGGGNGWGRNRGWGGGYHYR